MKNINFKGKKVLIRVDFNVPFNGQMEVTDATRIVAALPTINYVLEQGGRVILMSHLGRPLKKLMDDGSINVEKFSLKNVVPTLSEKLNRSVAFSENTVGEDAENLANNLSDGDVLLLENTRFHKGEKTGDVDFAKQLARLGDIYVNDAFGTAHRAHASTAIVANFFSDENKAPGFLIEKEMLNANKVLNNPAHPMTAIVGGAKVSDKILLLDKLIDSSDNIIIGGGMAYTFFKAMGGEIGNSLCEDDRLETAKALLVKAKAENTNIYLPYDSVIADEFNANARVKIQDSDKIPTGWMGLDIGPKAIETFSEVIKNSKTILWNGPMGVFEMDAFAKGTKSIAHAVADATQNGAFSLIGGGDSVAAIKKVGLADKVSFISTGGGAMLEYLEGKELPGIKAVV